MAHQEMMRTPGHLSPCQTGLQRPRKAGSGARGSKDGAQQQGVLSAQTWRPEPGCKEEM